MIEAKELDTRRRAAGFDQAALDAAARLGFANGAFEDSPDEQAAVVEEFYPDPTPNPQDAGDGGAGGSRGRVWRVDFGEIFEAGTRADQDCAGDTCSDYAATGGSAIGADAAGSEYAEEVRAKERQVPRCARNTMVAVVETARFGRRALQRQTQEPTVRKRGCGTRFGSSLSG